MSSLDWIREALRPFREVSSNHSEESYYDFRAKAALARLKASEPQFRARLDATPNFPDIKPVHEIMCPTAIALERQGTRKEMRDRVRQAYERYAKLQADFDRQFPEL